MNSNYAALGILSETQYTYRKSVSATLETHDMCR